VHELDGSRDSRYGRVVAAAATGCDRHGQARPDPRAAWKHGVANGSCQLWCAICSLAGSYGVFERLFDPDG
jgi:hypothetical protein